MSDKLKEGFKKERKVEMKERKKSRRQRIS